MRHAHAGEREEWEGDDRLRPLDELGERRAQELVELLDGFEVHAILTSPYRRCVQTVAPLAAARGLQVEHREELGEELQATAGAELVRALARSDVVVCGHGGLEQALPGEPRFKKGAVLVVDASLAVLRTL